MFWINITVRLSKRDDYYLEGGSERRKAVSKSIVTQCFFTLFIDVTYLDQINKLNLYLRLIHISIYRVILIDRLQLRVQVDGIIDTQQRCQIPLRNHPLPDY